MSKIACRVLFASCVSRTKLCNTWRKQCIHKSVTEFVMGLPLTLTHVMPQSCTELKNSAMHYQNLAPPQRCVDIQWWTPSVIKATGNRFGALAILQQITFRFRQYFLPLNLWSRLSNRSKHSKQTKMRWNFGHHWGSQNLWHWQDLRLSLHAHDKMLVRTLQIWVCALHPHPINLCGRDNPRQHCAFLLPLRATNTSHAKMWFMDHFNIESIPYSYFAKLFETFRMSNKRCKILFCSANSKAIDLSKSFCWSSKTRSRICSCFRWDCKRLASSFVVMGLWHMRTSTSITWAEDQNVSLIWNNV